MGQSSSVGRLSERQGSFPPRRLPRRTTIGELLFRAPQRRPSSAEQDGPTPTGVVRNDVNLQKRTFELVGHPTKADTYFINFDFDTTKACKIAIYYFARVVGDNQQIRTTSSSDQPDQLISFPSQLHQRFRQQDYPQLSAFDGSKCKPEHFELNVDEPVDQQVVPIVVRLQTQADSPQWQTTFVSLVKNGQGEIKPVVWQQNIFVEGVVYQLQDIYGYEDESNEEARNRDKEGEGEGEREEVPDDELQLQDVAECVICMMDKRNTTVLPCRHLCLCLDCAETLRQQTNKCPICRRKIDSLLHIDVKETVVAVAEAVGKGEGDDGGASTGAGAGAQQGAGASGGGSADADKKKAAKGAGAGAGASDADADADADAGAEGGGRGLRTEPPVEVDEEDEDENAEEDAEEEDAEGRVGTAAAAAAAPAAGAAAGGGPAEEGGGGAADEVRPAGGTS